MNNKNNNFKKSIGVDVGGTKVAVGLVSPSGEIITSMIGETNTSSPKATLDCIADIVLNFIDLKNIDLSAMDAIGFGIPGLVDPEMGIGLASVNLNWQNVPVRDELIKRIHKPCVIDNDVRTGAIGEGIYGHAKNLNNYIYLNVGTGVSAVIINERKVFKGENGLAGEIGHAIIDPQGPICKCGGRGCLEAVVSGPAIAQRANDKLKQNHYKAIHTDELIAIENISPEIVFKLAQTGNQIAIETLQEVGDAITYALQYLALAFDPELIILAGGVFMGGCILTDYIHQQLHTLASNSWVFNSIYRPDLVRNSALGAHAGLLGAAALVALSN